MENNAHGESMQMLNVLLSVRSDDLCDVPILLLVMHSVLAYLHVRKATVGNVDYEKVT